MKPPPGTYIRTSGSTADIFYNKDFYGKASCFPIATFTLRNDNNTLVWTWESGDTLEFTLKPTP